MIQASVFLNNRTQAVRLPKAVALDDDVRQVTVVAVGRARVIAPHDWSNIWVYGMDIFMVGYATYEEMSQRATLLLPNTQTFQYERTHVKNLSLLISKLKPMQKLLTAAS